MPTTATDFLRDLRIDEIMEDLQDVRTLPPALSFLGRLKDEPADNKQLVAKHQGRVQIAPMIAFSAKAPVFKAEKFSVESNTLGKIKFGTHWSEDEIRDWQDLLNSTMRDPQGLLAGGMVRKAVARQLMGIDQQREFLAVAMALDGQFGTGSYSRFGFTLDNVSWGRYADLKRTVSVPWEANPTTATPINDLLIAKQYYSERYGRVANRITMPTAAFRAMIATTEFQNKVRMFLAPNVSYINIPQVVSPQQRALATSVLDGMEIVLYDARYWSQNDDLSWANYRYWPLNPCPVLMDNSADDKDGTVQDFGVGAALEGEFADRRFTPNIVGDPAVGAHRAISYAYIKPDLDPIGLTIFSTMVCFPRLYQRDSNLVLNIGQITETIPTTDFSPA